ncbi:MAG: alpha/beta fold hydrolase, partial [Bosea sp. (in: a-proteobacteria)]
MPHRAISERTYSGASGNQLAATLRGQGQANVLLLHGGGQTRHAWDGTARALALTGWQSIALDQRGHGDSAWVEDGA